MAGTVVATATNAAESANGTTHTLVCPTVADNDWAVIYGNLAGSSTTLTASGIGGLSGTSPGGSTTRSGFGLHGWVRKLTAADSGQTLTVTSSSSLKVALCMVVIRGLDPDQIPTFGTGVNGLAADVMNPPAFTPAVGKILVHGAGIATASAAPPTEGFAGGAWVTPTGITGQTSRSTGGTTGRCGMAVGTQLTENTAISGPWDSDASSSWGILAVELTVAATSTPAGTASGSYQYTGSATGSTTPSGHAGGGPLFPWQNPATVDALTTDTPATSVTVGSTTTIAGATLVTPDDARFTYRGAGGMGYGSGSPDNTVYQPSSRYPNGWGNPAVYGVEFLITGTQFEYVFKWLSAAGAGWVRISVDGKRVTDLMYDIPGTSGGSRHTMKLTFGTSATRRILLEFQGVPFGGVFVPSGQTLSAVPAYDFRVIAQGDSVTAGSDENTGGSAGTWFARWARYAGVNVDPWNVAIGGTGMTAPGTAVDIPDRLADVTGHAPDVVIIWCGGNDGSTSITSAATQWINDVKTATDALVLVIGTWAPTVTATTDRQNRSNDLQAAALATGSPFIEPITGEVYDQYGALIASQGPWIATSGDVAAYVGSDNVHPTDAGHAYIAGRMLEAMQALDQPGGYEYTGTATGSAPAGGTATGGYTYGGTATGESQRAGTASGGYQYGGTASGGRDSAGAATGGYAYSSTATGGRDSNGTAAGSYSYTSSATGTAPSVDGASGSATGTHHWAGTATGARDSNGTSTGTYAYSGTASGGRDSDGTTSGAYAYTGTASGTAPAVGTASGTATGAYAYTGTAQGARSSAGAAFGAYLFTGTATGSNTTELGPVDPTRTWLIPAAPRTALIPASPRTYRIGAP